MKNSNLRRLAITCGIPVLLIPVPPLAIVFFVLSFYAHYPITFGWLLHLFGGALRRDYLFLRASARVGARIFDEFYSSRWARLQLMLLSFSAIVAVYELMESIRQGAGENFLEYLLAQTAVTAWLFFSIFAYASKLGVVEIFNRGLTRRIAFGALIIASVAFGRFLLLEFLNAAFPINASALTQTVYVGVFVKTLAIAGIGAILVAALFQFGLLAIILGGSRGRGNWHTFCLVICHASIIVSTYVLGHHLDELSRGTTGKLGLIYIAGSLDFSKKHICLATEEERVLYLEGVPDRALAARFPSLPRGELRHLDARMIEAAMPTGFRMVSCNPIEPIPAAR